MAQICAAICTSHSPFLFAPPHEWEPARADRARHGGIAADAPVDPPAENEAKHARCVRALGILRERLAASQPHVVVIFGDDQLEQFDFSNCPALGIFVGAQFSGYRISEKFGLPVPGESRQARPRTPEHWTTVNAHPAFARSLMTGLVGRGFDVSFSLELPKPEAGIGHAFMRPLYHLVPEGELPIVPFFVNCYYGPQPTARRCVQLGNAVREVIAAMPGDQRVAIIGSGGLWHMPMFPNASLDEEFDRRVLEGVRAGDAAAIASYFDERAPPVPAPDTGEMRLASGGTGMALGLGGGTGETRNWIITAATVDGIAGTVVDYVPIHASPVGAAFAYWSLP